jgi:hypothetical protein
LSEAQTRTATRGFVALVLAIVEVVAVVALALVVIRLAQQTPALESVRTLWSEELRAVALRWLPLLGVAIVAEAMARGRSPLSWGVAGRGGLAFQAESAFWLFALGGIVPLALTLLAPPQSEGLPWTDTARLAAAIAGPILAQEFFLTGYVNTRLSESLPKSIPPWLIAAAFAAAHWDHLGAGPLGPAFVGAMALQGYLWSSARTAGVSLLSLAVAHGVLLIAYEQPAIALAITAAVMLAMATRLPRWWQAVQR